VKPGMLCTGINIGCHSQLPDPVQPLQAGMLDKFVNKLIGDIDKSKNGIVDYFSLLLHIK